MAKCAVFVGDLHAGSTVALAPLTYALEADHNKTIPMWASEAQRWLHSQWVDFVKQVKLAAKGKDVVLVLGGDLIDGPRHHGTFQTVGTAQEQVSLAVSLLLPLAQLAGKRIYGLRGTACHGGQSGADDAAVVAELGGEARYRWVLDIDGRVFDVAHHGRRDGRPWTMGNVGLTAIRKAQSWGQTPDYIVRFHAHQGQPPITFSGVTYAACPSWQLQTEHGRKLDPANIDPIGGIIWTLASGLKTITYQPAPDPITRV